MWTIVDNRIPLVNPRFEETADPRSKMENRAMQEKPDAYAEARARWGCDALPAWNPNGGGLTCRRIRSHALVNVPCGIVHHSPDGPEWGYQGSGPAELALNICHAVWPARCDGQPASRLWAGSTSFIAWAVHQSLKRKWIAALPYEGGEVHGRPLRLWMLEASCRVAADSRDPRFVRAGLLAVYRVFHKGNTSLHLCHWCDADYLLDWSRPAEQLADQVAEVAAHPFDCNGPESGVILPTVVGG